MKNEKTDREMKLKIEWESMKVTMKELAQDLCDMRQVGRVKKGTVCGMMN